MFTAPPSPTESVVLFCGRPSKSVWKASLGVGYLTPVLILAAVGATGHVGEQCSRSREEPVAAALSSQSKLRKVKRNSRIELNVLPNCPDTAKGVVCHVPQCPFCEGPQKKFHSGPIIKRNCASSGTGMSALRLLQIFPSIVSLRVLTAGTSRGQHRVHLLGP